MIRPLQFVFRQPPGTAIGHLLLKTGMRPLLAPATVQVIGILLSLATQWFLVRHLPAEVYGGLVYLTNLVLLVAQLGLFGFDALLVRQAGIHGRMGTPVASLMALAVMAMPFISLILCCLICKMGWAGPFFSNRSSSFGWLWALCVFQGLLLLLQALLQGLGKTGFALAGDKLMRPALLLACLTASFILAGAPSIWELIYMLAVVLIVVILVITAAARRKKLLVFRWPSLSFAQSQVRAAGALFGVQIASILQGRIDILMLGQISGAVPTGQYHWILKLSELVPLIPALVNLGFAPKAAQLYHAGQQHQLQQAATQAARQSLLLSLPLILSLAAVHPLLFEHLHITDGGASTAFLLLLGTQLINVLTGSVGVLLLMTGKQGYALLGIGIACFLNVMGNLLWTPIWGMKGAAAATAFSIVGWNTILYLFVRRKLHLRTTAFGFC